MMDSGLLVSMPFYGLNEDNYFIERVKIPTQQVQHHQTACSQLAFSATYMHVVPRTSRNKL